MSKKILLFVIITFIVGFSVGFWVSNYISSSQIVTQSKEIVDSVCRIISVGGNVSWIDCSNVSQTIKLCKSDISISSVTRCDFDKDGNLIGRKCYKIQCP